MSGVSLILITALLFYLLVPGIGAFAIRGRWRRFRRRVIEASYMPILTYARVRAGEGGQFRFFGRLEAVQGDHRVWLSDGHLSVALDLEGVSIHVIPRVEPTQSRSWGVGKDDTPRVLTWESLGSLPEGTPFFVSGHLEQGEGAPTFRNVDLGRLFVMLYEESDRRLLARSIWVGRQRNEYWNLTTPVAMAAGFVAQLLLAYLFFQESGGRLLGLTSLTLALLPALPLFPPGLITFFAYRRLWGRGRLLRARRDLLRLPNRFDFRPDRGNRWVADLPSGGLYVKELIGESVHPGGRAIRRGVEEETGWYHFYPALGEGDSPDPWAEDVIVSGDPDTLARKAEGRARKLETGSLILFAVTILVNSYLAFLFLSYLL
ncbi:MAG: hypothetical protein ACLFP6_00800 [Spirochaetaceae bacterium]